LAHRISGRKADPVQERAAGNPVEMHENWLRTARGRPLLRPPATARIRTTVYSRPAGGTTQAEPRWSRGAYRVCGRLAGSTGSPPCDDQTRLRSGQEQNAGRQQVDRKMVHPRCSEKPLRAPERDDVRNDFRDSGNTACKGYSLGKAPEFCP